MKAKDLKSVEEGLKREVLGEYGSYKVYDTNDEISNMLEEVMEGKADGDTISLTDINQIRDILFEMTNVFDINPQLNDLEKLQVELNSRNMKRVIKKVGVLLSEDMCDIIEDMTAKNRLIQVVNSLPSNVTEGMMEKLEADKEERESE